MPKYKGVQKYEKHLYFEFLEFNNKLFYIIGLMLFYINQTENLCISSSELYKYNRPHCKYFIYKDAFIGSKIQ